jgi:hypothetical protein
MRAGLPRQRIQASGFTLTIVDLSGLDEPASHRQRLATAQHRQLFQLDQRPPFRAIAYTEQPHETHLALTLHHIICDAWSLEVLTGQLCQGYRHLTEADQAPPPRPALQYRDFRAWWDRPEQRGDEAAAQTWWSRHLAGDVRPLALPYDRPRPKNSKGSGRIHHFSIPVAVTQHLQQLARERETGLYAVLLTAVKTLLHKMTGQQLIRTGCPVTRRRHPDLQDQIGFYISTVVLQDRVGPKQTYLDLLTQVRQTILGAHQHHGFPLEQMTRLPGIARSGRRNPLFDVWVVLQEETCRHLELGGSLSVDRMDESLPISMFDLSFQFEHNDGAIDARLQYDDELFEADTIELMAARFLILLELLATDATRPLGELDLDEALLASIELG